MTSQPESTPEKAPRASQVTEPLRELAALVLVAANALLLLVGLIDLVVPFGEGSEFSDRAGPVFFSFLGITGIALPFLAVLLATHVQPPVRRAREITLAAVAEYAVSAVFGGLAILAWLVGSLAEARIRDAFTGLLVRGAYLAIFAIAAIAVVKVWRTLYYVPKPKPQPGVYGQARPYGHPGYPPPGAGQQGYPTGYPQGSGFPPGAGQPGPYGSSPDHGQPGAFGQPGAYGQPAGYPQPGGYGQPGGPAPAGGVYGQAPGTPAPPSAPFSAPPVPSAPPAPFSAPPVASAPPVSSAPPVASAPPVSSAPPADVVEPTQVIPPPRPPAAATPPSGGVPGAGSEGDDSERTRVINPASQQPSAGTRPPGSDIDDEPTETRHH